MNEPVFDLVWSGARTNYGVKEGKVCFEVRISEEVALSSHFKDEPFVRGLRCGFSTTDSNLLIGESKASFALCENGKKATNGEFAEFGKPFGLDDVIGCYLDLDSSPCNIQFTLNGEDLGTAFEFEKSEVLGEGEEKALFPHILTKGYELQVNFADNENLLGNVVPPKREKKAKKVEAQPVVEKKEESEEQKTNGNEEEGDKKESEGDKKESEDDKKQSEGDKKENEDAIVPDEDQEMKSEDSEEKKEEEQKPEEHKPKEEEKKEENKIEKVEDKTEEIAEEEEEEPKPRETVFLLPEYQLIGLIDESKLISGPQRCESRKECEVYLLVGLPGSGKTNWTINHIKENPDKRYNIIGPDSLMAKMTVSFFYYYI